MISLKNNRNNRTANRPFAYGVKLPEYCLQKGGGNTLSHVTLKSKEVETFKHLSRVKHRRERRIQMMIDTFLVCAGVHFGLLKKLRS